MFLLVVALPILTIGFATTFFLGGYHKDEPEKAPKSHKEEKQTTEEESPTEEVEAATNESKEKTPNLQHKESEKVALDFMKAYYPYDINEPEAHLERAKKYMSESAYEKDKEAITKGLVRPSLNRVKTNPKSFETYPVEGTPDGQKIWNVIVNGEITSNDGKKSMEDVWFWVTLEEQEDGKWLVEGVRQDG